MALAPNPLREVPPPATGLASTANRVSGAVDGFSKAALVADHTGMTHFVSWFTKAGNTVDGVAASVKGFFGFAPPPATVVDSAAGYLGKSVEFMGGLAPVLVTAGDGIKAVTNLVHGNVLKGAVNITSGAAKVAAITVMAPLGFAALGVEGISWLATGKSSLTHVSDAVEHVFGETGDVESKTAASTEWRDKILAERGKPALAAAAAPVATPSAQAGHVDLEAARRFAAAQSAGPSGVMT